jgi:hypothetical protein
MKTFIFTILLIISQAAWAKDKFYYTVSGGVSLGVYEGGFLYYMNEMLRINDKIDSELTHSTGASAGGYNSLLTAFSKCSLKKINSLKESYHYQGWTTIGVDQLFKKENVRADQIFSPQDGMSILNILEKDFSEGFREGCKIILGIAVTRFNPVDVEVNKNIMAPNMSEEAAIEITGRGRGKSPLVTNFHFKKTNKRQLLMPFNGEAKNDFTLLKDLILASTSFPVAFPPTTLKHCQKNIHDPYFECRGDKVKENIFIDGGVFNNSPVLLSYTIAKEFGIDEDDSFVWVNPSKAGFTEGIIKKDMRFPGFFDYGGEFMGNFVTSGRSRDLVMIALLAPEVNKKIKNSELSLPPIGNPLSAFFGFFEEDFRIFDFYLGMVDAHIMMEKYLKLNVKTPENEKSADWIPYYCLRGYLTGDKRSGEICQKNQDVLSKNFIALTQVSLNTLYNKCRELKSKPRKNGHCLKAFDKLPPPEIVVAKNEIEEWIKKENESDFKYTIRQLERYEFHFKDLGLKEDDYKEGTWVIRNKLGDIVNTWVEKLPSSEQLVLKESASTFLNQEIYFVPKKESTYITLGSAFEFGRNFSRIDAFEPTYIKFSLSLFVQNGSAWLTGNSTKAAISPLLGAEFILPFSDYKWQYLLGLKAGYQFTNNDDFGGQPCSLSDEEKAVWECTTSSLLPYVGFTYMQIARFQMILNYLPEFSKSTSMKRAIFFQLGVDI